MANEPAAAAPPKSGRKGLIIWILLSAFALGAGASVPFLLGGSQGDGHTPKKTEAPKSKRTALPFDNIVVNLGEERLSRFLRVKLLVAVEESDVKEVTDLLSKQKAFLKSWLFEYLSDQSFHDVSRKVGLNRLRREICDRFNSMLYPHGEEKILEVLFDEFVVQ